MSGGVGGGGVVLGVGGWVRGGEMRDRGCCHRGQVVTKSWLPKF